MLIRLAICRSPSPRSPGSRPPEATTGIGSNQHEAMRLRILVEGGRALLNRYSVIMLTPEEHRPEGREPAQRLATWLLSLEGQTAIGAYMLGGQRLFHPAANPRPE